MIGWLRRPPPRIIKTEPVMRIVAIDGEPRQIAIVRSSRTTSVRMSWDRRGGHLRLSMPIHHDEADALRWALDQRAWLRKVLDAHPAPIIVDDGIAFPLRGDMVTLHWDARARRTPQQVDDQIIVGGPRDTVSRRIERWLRAEALRQLTDETFACAHAAGLQVARVGIGDPISQWGSCTHDGMIRYSWRLIMAPPFVLSSTVAHEVAHRRHMDHSLAFHALVDQISSANPRAARRWLRQHGQSLHRYRFGST